MRLTLNIQILLGAILGIAAGLILKYTPLPAPIYNSLNFTLNLFGTVFINLLKMILIPLIFTSIAVGVANLREGTRGKKIWPLFLCYTLTTSSIAIITGLIAANIFKPGANLNISLFQEQTSQFKAQSMSVSEFGTAFINGLFVNPIKAMADGNVLAVIIFAAFLGAGLIALKDKAQTTLKVLNEFFDVVMVIVGWIMRLAPLGIMGLLAKMVLAQDMQLFKVLGEYIAIVLGTTLFHGIITLPAILWLVTGRTPIDFFKATKDALIMAFSTSSSSATLPVTLRCTEENLKVDKSITRFVVPVGATLNMDGTALYEAMAALFIANLCGLELTLLQQVIVAMTAMMASIGAPGIPSAGMVTMVMVLQSVGLPAEAIAILIPIDRPLDSVRTAVNVQGDAIGSCVVQKYLKRES